MTEETKIIKPYERNQDGLYSELVILGDAYISPVFFS